MPGFNAFGTFIQSTVNVVFVISYVLSVHTKVVVVGVALCTVVDACAVHKTCDKGKVLSPEVKCCKDFPFCAITDSLNDL